MVNDENEIEEGQNILDDIDPNLRKKFESELSHIFEDLEEDQDLGKAVEQIFDETNDLNEIQTKIILLIKEHLEIEKKLDLEKNQDIDADEEKIARDVTELCRKMMQDLDEEIDPTLGKISKKDRAHMLNLEAKKNIKKIMKNFAVYEVYKIMNPKRIAGETAKDNYKHNLMRGGQKLAGKYEGGKAADLQKYGPEEVNRIQKHVMEAKKGGGIER
jgi:hypothetical protein